MASAGSELPGTRLAVLVAERVVAGCDVEGEVGRPDGFLRRCGEDPAAQMGAEPDCGKRKPGRRGSAEGRFMVLPWEWDRVGGG